MKHPDEHAPLRHREPLHPLRKTAPRQGYAASVTHTHTLTFAAGTVTKRYTSWDRGEPRREWAALQHIHRHAPDLAPQPITADLDNVPPTVTMTVVPGQPMNANLTPSQVRALTTAIRGLWAVPLDDLLQPASSGPDRRVAARTQAAAAMPMRPPNPRLSPEDEPLGELPGIAASQPAPVVPFGVFDAFTDAAR